MATDGSEIKVKFNYLRIPPRKVRFVADLIRGLPVEEAEAKLLINPRRPKENLVKLLRSAVAAAKNNHNVEAAKLFVKEIRVDGGPMFKRWTTRARGGVDPIQKKTSHVTLVLGVSEKISESRFNIVKPKKEKKNKKENEEKEPTIKTEPVKEMKETDKKKPSSEAGTFKKMFRRKAI